MWSWYCYSLPGDALPDAATFIRNEEEGAVFHDRPAERSAELILVFLRLDRIEVTLCIQNRIAEILVDIAVPLIRARFRHDVHHGARVAAVLGVKGVANNAKLVGWIVGRLAN